jgi:hypothetical protein
MVPPVVADAVETEGVLDERPVAVAAAIAPEEEEGEHVLVPGETRAPDGVQAGANRAAMTEAHRGTVAQGTWKSNPTLVPFWEG